jgi:uncharacterized membrane protein YbhN (UPF0104 family)
VRAETARKVAWNAAKVLIAGGLIAYLATSGQIRAEVLGRALGSPGSLAFSMAALGVTFVFAILRWWILLRAIDIHVPLRTAAKLTFIGGFFNTFMPGAVGGDAFKMYYALDHAPEGKKVEAATTVAVDRVLGLGAMFLLVVVAATVPSLLGTPDAVVTNVVRLLSAWAGPIGKPAAVLLVLFILGCLATFHPGVRDWAIIRQIREKIPGAKVGGRAFRAFVRSIRSPVPVLLAVACSCCAHLCTVACFFVIGRAIGENTLGLSRYVLLVPIGLMVNAIPGSPAGIGIGEAAYEKLFEIALGAGVSSPGADICVVWRIMTIGWNLIGGVIYVLHRRGEPRPSLVRSS